MSSSPDLDRRMREHFLRFRIDMDLHASDLLAAGRASADLDAPPEDSEASDG